uniref:Putative Ezrin n=1 Tax=Schistosoma japonicum TaxID=6182 RepID=C1LD79_SCHJA|nr:putative Ezrin [Schistosoma japonicum]
MRKTVSVSVFTMDSQLDFSLALSANGHQLFTQVCRSLGIREIWYFGMQYMDHKNRPTWLEFDKKMRALSSSMGDRLQFFFKVKYYPEEVSEDLVEDITRLYLYYNVKNDIIDGKIYCPAETAVLLSSYQAYIRHGKYDPSVHNQDFIKVEKYLPKNVREQHDVTDVGWNNKIMKCLVSLGDMFREEAIMDYLKIAQDLEMYGVSYFKIKNTKQTDLWLGISALGLNMYRLDNQLSPVVVFPWNEIQKLSYSQNKFYVKPVGASGEVLTLYTDSTHTSRLILNLSMGNHKLYAVRRQPDSIEVQQMKVKAKERQAIRDAEREKLHAEQKAREVMEKRLLEMQRLMQENEEAFARTQMILEQYERKVNELNAQLNEEKRARQKLENLQSYLEETNRKLEMESMQSAEERQRLSQERDEITAQICKQTQLLQEREEEKRQFEAELARVRAMHEEIMKSDNGQKRESDERELEAVNNVDEELRRSKEDTDQDHATRLKILRQDLSAVRNPNKMQAIDIQYEDNVKKGMDKYRTLRAIREGNTKKRVDQFESM